MSVANNRLVLIDDIQDGLGALAGAAGHDGGLDLGDVCETLCERLQALGICNLLLNADPEGLFRNLLYAAFARRYHLQRNVAAPQSDHTLAISRSGGVFAAVASGEIALARELVALSPRQWLPDGEYEDDYWYMQIIHDYLPDLERTDAALLAPALAEFERSLEGAASARLLVCKALLDKNAADFPAAFDALLQERGLHLAKLEKAAGDDPVFPAISAVFVEGLALLWFAQRAGLPKEPEYQYCPILARPTAPQTLPYNLFVDLDRLGKEYQPEPESPGDEGDE